MITDFRIFPVSGHSSSDMKILVLLHKAQATAVDIIIDLVTAIRERDIQAKTDAKKGCQRED